MKSKKPPTTFEIEFTPDAEDKFIDTASYPSWSSLRSVAILTARSHPNEIIYIDVGKQESAKHIDDALLSLAEEGEIAALQIEVRCNSLH